MYDAMNTNNSRAQKYLSIMALGFAGGSIYLIPFIRYVFYTWQADAMMITNQQLGILSTMYAIGNTLLYIPGGIVSDKFSTKKCLLFSLMSTTVLTFMFAMRVNSYSLALVIWLLFAFTTTFLFWCALMKTIRMLGSESEQGFLFGLYYMGNGLSGALINTIALKFTSEGASAVSNFKVGVYVYGASTLVAFILIFFFVKDTRGSEEAEDEKFRFNQVGALLRNPALWLFSAIVFTGYALFSSASYLTPYLTDVVGLSPTQSGYLSIVRSYIFYIFSPISGIIADKVFKSTSKWFMLLYVILTLLYIGIILIPSSVSSGFIGLYSLLPGLFGLALYGIIFSVASEAKIPVALLGTAVGIVSIVGYSSDLFAPALFGRWIDNAEKAGSLTLGYNKIFIFLAICCIVGLVASALIFRNTKRKAKEC